MGSRSWAWACGWALAGVLGLAMQACSNQPSGVNNALADSGGATQDSGSDATLQDTGPVFIDSSPGPADSGKTTDTGVTDTGTPPADTGPGPTESGVVTDTGAAMQDSATGTGDCGTTPSLHPGSGTNLYCPYGPGGTAIQCVTGSQLCCISGKVGATYPPSDCEALSDAGCTVGQQADAGSAQIQCEDPTTDCPAGDVCCGAPDTVAPSAGCSYDRLYGLEYTRCEHATACQAGEFQVCATATGECPAGKACTPFKATLDLGYCK
jgi:hypothetical protein